MSKAIEISNNIVLHTGCTKEEELNGHFATIPYPTINFNGTYSAGLAIENKRLYEGFTRDLFFNLASRGKLKCPKCGKLIDFDLDDGDSSVGLQGCIMAGCSDDSCYYSMDGQTKEIEEELIKDLFPLYWRWNNSEEEKKL